MQEIYSVFKCHIPSINGDELPEKFEDLPESDQHDIRDLYRAFILHWVDNEFLAMTKDEDRINLSMLMMIRANNEGMTPPEQVRMGLSSFVLMAAGHPCMSKAEEAIKEVMKDVSNG